MKIPVSVPLYPEKMKEGSLLFYTYANKRYHPFAALYPLFALVSNPRSIVEICLSEPRGFVRSYSGIIDFYANTFPGRVLYTFIDPCDIFSNSLRFLVQPQSRAQYVYIGDVDILLLEKNILDWHLRHIQEYNLDFSNVVREGAEELTGLHFIEYDAMFPVQVVDEIDLRSTRDEVLLYKLMSWKGLKIPSVTDLTHRPVHGLHISFFSRPLFPTLTTGDRLAAYPTWYGQSEETDRFVEEYLNVRYASPIVDFMRHIRDDNVKLRQLVQIVDIFCAYCRDVYCKANNARVNPIHA